MSEFVPRVAGPEDDRELTALAARAPVPGAVSLRYERSPSYLAGCRAIGRSAEALVLRHRASGRLAGLACRSVRRVFVNGEPADVGYLGQLRVDPAFRSRGLVGRGFRFIRGLDEGRGLPGYITTIVEGNSEALGVLVDKPRPGMPRYRFLERLRCLAIPARRAPPADVPGTEFRAGDAHRLGDVCAFLRDRGRARQFAPCWEEEDFAEDGGLVPGFGLRDLVVASSGGRIVGTAGLWDQSAYKQFVVTGYSRLLSMARPWMRAFGLADLPPPGERLRMAHLSFAAVDGDDPAVFAGLLGRVLNLAADRGIAFGLLGLSERDPLLRAARAWRHVSYRSRLYTVGWEGQEAFHERLDGRPSGLEFAAL